MRTGAGERGVEGSRMRYVLAFVFAALVVLAATTSSFAVGWDEANDLSNCTRRDGFATTAHVTSETVLVGDVSDTYYLVKPGGHLVIGADDVRLSNVKI